MSCPRLPREAFEAARLDAQLDREARRFLADPTHLRVDEANRVVHVSMYFKWYEDDFLRWLTGVKGIEPPHIIDYLKLYVPREVSDMILRRLRGGVHQVRLAAQ